MSEEALLNQAFACTKHGGESTFCRRLQASDGSDSSEEEDFDDDQMFQMDDKIAAALKVMARGGANARESREALASFKFRVIGLLEIYVKKVHNTCSASELPSAPMHTVSVRLLS